MNDYVSLRFKKWEHAPSLISINLPASKSISNRLLILQYLYFPDLIIENLSNANDTQLMKNALQQLSINETIDVEDAGTVARFISAVALFSDKEILITGTKRMQDRPIDELIHVLETLGASIQFTNKKNHIPFIIKGISNIKENNNSLQLSLTTIKSSQFLSAILMIAPKLKRKVTIQLIGERNSWSYVEMTIKIMRSFGFIVDLTENSIVIEPFTPKLNNPTFYIENDWSAASFLIELLSFFPNNSAFQFNNLYSFNTSLQGDAILCKWEQDFNLRYISNNNNSIFEVTLPSGPAPQRSFNNNPDLALPYLMSMVLQKKVFTINHVESLQFKESDRMAAIKEELLKCHVHFTEFANGYTIDASNLEIKPKTVFNSHNDHRIAMCLAPLAMIQEIIILEPAVVNKSFPKYWDELRKLNFEVNYY